MSVQGHSRRFDEVRIRSADRHIADFARQCSKHCDGSKSLAPSYVYGWQVTADDARCRVTFSPYHHSAEQHGLRTGTGVQPSLRITWGRRQAGTCVNQRPRVRATVLACYWTRKCDPKTLCVDDLNGSVRGIFNRNHN
jgi:hypothetical protein